MLKKWMKDKIKNWYITLLQILLLTVAVSTLINVSIVYWYVDIFPLSCFTAVWFTIQTFVQMTSYMLLNVVVILVILFGAVFTIEKKHLLWPLITLGYLIYDLYRVITMFISGLGNGLWKLFVPQMCISGVMIILLLVYCYITFRKKFPRKKTYY